MNHRQMEMHQNDQDTRPITCDNLHSSGKAFCDISILIYSINGKHRGIITLFGPLASSKGKYQVAETFHIIKSLQYCCKRSITNRGSLSSTYMLLVKLCIVELNVACKNVSQLLGQGNTAKNINHNIQLKICNNDRTDDMIDPRQNTLQRHNIIAKKNIH